MPYYEKINLLFIHIPKTGGSVIENTIKCLTPQKLYSDNTNTSLECISVVMHSNNTLLEFPYNKKSLQHQFYTTLYKFKNKLNINFDNIKIFSVVRNPYDRIISDLFYLNLIKQYFTSEQVYDVIKNNYLDRDDLDNHNQPQYKFIVDENDELIKNIKIFNTETLNESNEELKNFVGLDINIKQNGVNKDYSKYLNKDSIALINTFYKKDFELFNYKLKTDIE